MIERADVAVVGLGLIGAAATRHLANAGVDVIGVGPGEPDDWSTHDGPYASHYDSGRVTRRLDARREWAILASRAIEQYAEIESSSGITFHNPAGLVFVRNDAAGIANQRDVIADLGLDVGVGVVDEHGLATGIGEYRFPPGWTTLIEPAPAGVIDPRAMARAQVVAAQHAGARIRHEVVSMVDRHRGGWRMDTPSGPIDVNSVLLATGPYLQELHGLELQASVRPEAVIIGTISDAEANRVAGMPSSIYLLDHPEIDDTYFNPPMRYPDGRFAIKMGGSNAKASVLNTTEEKAAWMSGSADSQFELMRDVLTEVLPGVAFESFKTKPCLITDTSSGLPYVDEIESGLFVAAGGNGHAAKSADAIGSLAAKFVATGGTWPDDELSSEAFSARVGSWTPPAGSRHGN